VKFPLAESYFWDDDGYKAFIDLFIGHRKYHGMSCQSRFMDCLLNLFRAYPNSVAFDKGISAAVEIQIPLRVAMHTIP